MLFDLDENPIRKRSGFGNMCDLFTASG